ncbi:MAG: TIGR00159 family protein [Tissierellia bacterium]|nr:TIGR00159 family protein [Tissierellia bacterium]
MGVIIEQFKLMTITDLIDIAIVALVFYKGLSLIKETRAEQLVKGLVLIFIFDKISYAAQLYTINWILTNMLSVGVIAVLIVFQPELRRGLEYFGRTKFFGKSFKEARTDKINEMVEEIVEATASLSRQQIGAIMVLGRKTGLNEFIETGTYIDGVVSSSLLINIFIPNTPLHDGAVIIKDGSIKAAACYLPLTDNKNLNKELGTRHRAALGISERSDALVIVVSEETGSISIAENGELRRHLDKQTLRDIIMNMDKDKDRVVSLLDRWRDRNEKKEEEESD